MRNALGDARRNVDKMISTGVWVDLHGHSRHDSVVDQRYEYNDVRNLMASKRARIWTVYGC